MSETGPQPHRYECSAGDAVQTKYDWTRAHLEAWLETQQGWKNSDGITTRRALLEQLAKKTNGDRNRLSRRQMRTLEQFHDLARKIRETEQAAGVTEAACVDFADLNVLLPSDLRGPRGGQDYPPRDA